MHRLEAFGLAARQVHAPHGTNLESFVFDALNDPAGQAPGDGIRFDDGQGPLKHPAIIASDLLSYCGKEPEMAMSTMAGKQQKDPDVHKGAIEGDRPTDEQMGNPQGDGIDENGLPDDPIATAQDEIGANEDESGGG